MGGGCSNKALWASSLALTLTRLTQGQGHNYEGFGVPWESEAGEGPLVNIDLAESEEQDREAGRLGWGLLITGTSSSSVIVGTTEGGAQCRIPKLGAY